MSPGQFALAALRYALSHLVRLCSSAIPRDDRRWVFTSGSGDRFAGNSKYLFLYTAERGDIRPIWITSDRDIVRELSNAGYEAYYAESIRGRYTLLRARRIFRTGSAAFWPYTGGAEYIQLWHANPTKRMGYDKDERLSPFDWFHSRYVSFDWDRFVVTSAGPPKQVYAGAYRIPEDRILVAGYPRNDALFRDVQGIEIGLDTKAYGRVRELHEEHTIVSYMPTWRRSTSERDGRSIAESRVDLERVNHLMERADAYFLLKYHPLSTVAPAVEDLDRVLVLPAALDVSAVLQYVDVLVTDYSSVYLDFLLLDRPLVFYPFDLAEYRNSRGLYFEYDAVTPGPKAMDFEELYTELERALDGEDDYEAERAAVRERFYEYQDGESSRRVYEAMFGSTEAIDPAEASESW